MDRDVVGWLMLFVGFVGIGYGVLAGEALVIALWAAYASLGGLFLQERTRIEEAGAVDADA